MSIPSDGAFDGQPHLHGPSLELRPMLATDWDALFAVASDKEIWALHPANDRYTEPVFRRYFEDGLKSRGALVVNERETGSIIGASRYSSEFAEPGEIEIGWTFLARSKWGGGTNLEMKRLMLLHAFKFVDTVMFRVGAENARSRRAMEKIGAVLTDRIQLSRINGRDVQHVVYVITARTFATSPLAIGNA